MRTLRAILCGVAALYLCLPAWAQDGKLYKTPEEAVISLASAVAAKDDGRLKVILGADILDFLETDKAVRHETYRTLSLLFDERWALASTEDGSRIIRIGWKAGRFRSPW
jgi:hypothetical protein